MRGYSSSRSEIWIRTIRNPDLDQADVVQVFRRMIHDLLSQTP